MKHGFLLIHKPKGPTSHDVVATVRRGLNERQVGHLGTLDPQASGLLVLAVGAKALKVVELFQGLPKEYEAHVRFGAVSTTYDSEGVIEPYPPRAGWTPPDHTVMQRTLEQHFLGRIQQVPPAFSAIKVNGQSAHRAARKGTMLALPPRTIEIHSCKIVHYDYPSLVLDVACGSGTYIRSLANDLGDVLRCGAYLSGLHRTTVGAWSISDAVEPDKAQWTDVRPLKDILTSFSGIDIEQSEADDLRFGRSIPREVRPDTIAWCDGLPMAILVPMKDGSRGARPRKVL